METLRPYQTETISAYNQFSLIHHINKRHKLVFSEDIEPRVSQYKEMRCGFRNLAWNSANISMRTGIPFGFTSRILPL